MGKLFHSKKCVLSTLENPMLNGILVGLEIKEGELLHQEKVFPCCSGEGQFFNEHSNTVVRCSLPKRFKRVHDLFVQYYQTWGALDPALPHLMPPDQSAALLRHVADVLKGNAPQANLRYASKGKPGELWTVALAAAWRFGAKVDMRTMGRPAPVKAPRPTYSAEGLEAGPEVILIEQVDRLWDPATVNEFEAIVSLAYSSNACLWIEFIQEDIVKKNKSNSTHSATNEVARRVNQIKSKSPLDFLEPNILSRLRSLASVPRLPV